MKVGAKFVTVKPVSIFTLSHVIFPCLGDFNVPSEDCYRISKEIENLRSQLALKKKELKCYQQNKKLRVELDLKVKEVECLRKENEELKAESPEQGPPKKCMLSTFKLPAGITNASMHVQKQTIFLLQDIFLLHPILCL